MINTVAWAVAGVTLAAWVGLLLGTLWVTRDRDVEPGLPYPSCVKSDRQWPRC